MVKASFQYAIVAAVSCAATWAAFVTHQRSSFAAVVDYATKPGAVVAFILWLHGVEDPMSIMGTFVANIAFWIVVWFLLRTLWKGIRESLTQHGISHSTIPGKR